MCNILPCHTRYRKRADGTEESYSYDKADRLSTQTDKNADGTICSSYTYTYDGAGNIIKIGGTADTAAGHAVMTYDKDNRLATYNGEKVTYDERGNMLYGPLDGEMGDYTYDCRNRLIETKAADGTVTAYTYDAENTRLTEETANTRHTFVTDKETTYSQLLTETISEKHLLTYKENATITYTYGNGLISDSRKEAKDSDTEKRYYHYNHIGSTTAITDADGDLLYRIAYGTYGELTGIYDADGQKMAGEAADQRSIRETLQAEKLRFQYNGRYGVETGADGLYYMRARYYNPQIKRFINRDIIDGSITDSQSLNKYSYVQGNLVKVEGRGSTGRTIPNNLGEQMAMHQVRSDPLEGATELPIKLNDTRWKSSDGWGKMQSVVETVDGNKITIHYVYNKVTGTFDDFKF